MDEFRVTVFPMNGASFNKLEFAVLGWYIKHYSGTPIAVQLESAKFLNREWTKAGFYTDFEVDNKRANSLNNSSSVQVKIPIDGPFINSKDIEYGGGALLWAENGFLNKLEMFACGVSFSENVNDFTLTESPATPDRFN